MRINTMKSDKKTWKLDYFESLPKQNPDEKNEVNEINEESK